MKATLSLVATLFISLHLSGQEKKRDVFINLSYTPREETQLFLNSKAEGKTVVLGQVIDLRKADQAIVGENRKREDVVRVLKTNTPVTEFVKTTWRKCYSKWGGIIKSDASVILNIEVQDFFVIETDLYRTQIALRIYTTNAEGKVLFETTETGSARVWGLSMKEENYNEGFTDALQDIYEHTFSNPNYWKSWEAQNININVPVTENDKIKNDLVKLKNSGFDDQALLNYIRQKAIRINLNADEMVAWKNAGLSQSVIMEVISNPEKK